MTELEIKQTFKETYPDFMRGDEPLSPYFDIWEYAIEIATKELEAQIEEMKCCLSKWYEYENERDTPQINIDELLTETQQLIS